MTVTGYWLDQAACLDVNPAVFEAKTPQGQQAAIRDYCQGCPVRAECLADALSTSTYEDHGVRGGKTRKQRLALGDRTDLPTGRDSVTIAALRQLLDQEQPDVPQHPAPRPKPRATKESTVPETTTPTTAPAKPEMPTAVEPEPLLPAVRSISDLLNWAERHPEAAMRKHAAQAREALTVIQKRRAVDAELEKVLREADELRERLAALDARAKELKTPGKAKTQRDHDPKVVRAWAREQGLECPKLGVVPKTVVQAWREQNAA